MGMKKKPPYIGIKECITSNRGLCACVNLSQLCE